MIRVAIQCSVNTVQNVLQVEGDKLISNKCVTKGAVYESSNFIAVGPVLACGADPRVEVEEGLSGGNAHWEVSVTAWTTSNPALKQVGYTR